MNEMPSATFTARDLEAAKARGALEGEVRILKWGAGIAIAAILGALGLLYQNQTVLHENVARVQERVVGVEKRLVGVEKRLVGVEKRVVGVEKRLDRIDNQLATISSQLATVIATQNRSQ